MKVLLISANTESLNMPALPLGLGHVAAALRQVGHRIALLDLMSAGNPQSALEDEVNLLQPDVIGISIRNVDDQVSEDPRFLLGGARDLVGACKRLTSSPVVLGGAGYSLFPEAALDYLGADMGVQGEGEEAFPALLQRLEAGTPLRGMPGLYLRSGGLQGPRAFLRRLDDSPFPEPEWFDARLYQDPACYLPFQTRRGCPLKCSYCSTSLVEGALIRKRSPASVVHELGRWRRAGFSRVFFVDNTFNLPPGYALDLCDALREARLELSWRCILYPGHLDAGLVQAMAAAGCTEVSLGFESGNQLVLDGMSKRFTVEDVRRAAGMLRDAGIRRTGFLLLGGPDETRESAEESLQFVDDLGLETVKLTVGIRIYPDTRVAEIACREGYVDPRDNLLEPRFYLKRGLDAWLRQTAARWASERPGWIY